MEMEMKVPAREENGKPEEPRVSFELWQLLSSHIWNNEAHGSRELFRDFMRFLSEFDLASELQ